MLLVILLFLCSLVQPIQRLSARGICLGVAQKVCFENRRVCVTPRLPPPESPRVYANECLACAENPVPP